MCTTLPIKYNKNSNVAFSHLKTVLAELLSLKKGKVNSIKLLVCYYQNCFAWLSRQDLYVIGELTCNIIQEPPAWIWRAVLHMKNPDWTILYQRSDTLSWDKQMVMQWALSKSMWLIIWSLVKYSTHFMHVSFITSTKPTSPRCLCYNKIVLRFILASKYSVNYHLINLSNKALVKHQQPHHFTSLLMLYINYLAWD